jgi:hypothetical protein
MLQNKRQAMIKGALMLYLQPRLAADAKVDIDPMLEGIDNENYRDEIHTLMRRIVNALAGKLRAGASVSDLHQLLAALEQVPEAEGEDSDEPNKVEGVPCPGGPLEKLTAEDRHPYAARIGLDNMVQAPPVLSKQQRQRAQLSNTDGFASRFPDAAKIGVR